MRPNPITLFAFAAGLLVAGYHTAEAGEPASASDRAFVAMVSQGGMFEVQAGSVGAVQGSTQDIRDQGNTEQHDHMLVGDKLTSVAAAAGIVCPKSLNAPFSKMLATLKAAGGPAFDAVYLDDMKQIHAKDGAAFAKEAAGGSNPGLRAFAAETHRIVQRHIGELQAVGPIGS